MNKPINVLIVDDSEDDARLMLRELRSGGFDPHHRRVQTAAAMGTALAAERWDAVLSDFRMPGFTGMDALRIFRSTGIDIPFILVSGTIGEEVAVAAMKAGASDYLMKKSLIRLAPALTRELKEVQLRAAHRRDQVALVDSEERFRQMAENIRDVFFLQNAGGDHMFYVSPAYEEIWGRSCESLYADPQSWTRALHPDDRTSTCAIFSNELADGQVTKESRVIRPDGSIRWIQMRFFAVRDGSGKTIRIAGIAKDVTGQRKDEQKFKDLLEAAPDAIVIINGSGEMVLVNHRAVKLFGWRREELLGKKIDILMPERLRGKDQGTRSDFFAHPRLLDIGAGVELFGLRKDGTEFPAEISLSPLKTTEGSLVISSIRDVTERAERERQVRDSERRFKALFDQAPIAMALVDMQGYPTISNPSLTRMIGYSNDELAGMVFGDFTHPEDIARDLSKFAELMEGKISSYSIEKKYVHKAGHLVLANLFVTSISGENGLPREIIGMAEDITERKKAQDRIAYLNRVHTLLSGINTLIVRVSDRDQLFKDACRIAIEQGGLCMATVVMIDPGTAKLVPVASAGADEKLLSGINSILSSSDLAPKTMSARAILEKRAVVSNAVQSDPQVIFRTIYAESRVRSMAMFPLIVADEAIGVLGLYAREPDFFQVEELRLLKQLTDNIGFAINHIDKDDQLNYLAYYDALTGLANRSLLHDRLNQSIAYGERYHDPIWVVFVNIDRFSVVNSTFDHQAGDGLIKSIAARLQNAARETDTLARIGGDEFVLILQARPDEKLEPAIVQRLLETMAQPFTVGDQKMFLTCSAGLAIYPTDGEGAESLIKHADIAMQRAKASGGNSFRFYKDEMNAQAMERLRLVGELRNALEREEFVLHYQPQVDFRTGRIVGMEALIRWNHPELGLVPPVRFIALAEETGMIVPIGDWVIRTACRQNKAWQEANLGNFRVAVNLSALQLAQPELVQSIVRILQETRLDPCCLEIELTESMVMTEVEHAIDILAKLKSIGLQVSIDDFGTGYSSLAYLKRLPIDALKIDRSFVRDIAVDPGDAAIAKAIVAMAHSLGIRVVAEGGETVQQCDFLRRQMCDELQGFFFSKPLAPPEIEALLRQEDRFPELLALTPT